MTKRQTPPGFTSILWVVVVKPFGPHHLPMCSGSVHTFHTSSRGASKTRVPRISRSPTSAAFLLSAAMLHLPCALSFDEILQRSAQRRPCQGTKRRPPATGLNLVSDLFQAKTLLQQAQAAFHFRA